MFGGWYQIILEDDRNIDRYMRLAANNNLISLYKIGIYGGERQHELYVRGWFWNYIKFRHDMKPKKVS